MSNDQGIVKQFDIKSKKLVLNWGYLTPGAIMKMIYHKKSNTFFTSDTARKGHGMGVGNLKRWDIENVKLVKDYGIYALGGIIDMAVCESENLLFISGVFHIDILDLESGMILFNVEASSEIAAIAY